MLKNLLSLLLSKFYSKQESALVANQAMPGNSKIEITATSAPGDWQTVATYTAPCAGIASLRGQAINNTAFMQIMLEAGEPGKESPSITGFATTGQYPHIWLNVKKGDQIVFKAGAITQVFARFFKTVGEGYKDIIWRAVLCLSSYSSYYLKHSLNPKRNGSAVNLTLQTGSHYLPVLPSTYRLRTVLLQFIKAPKTRTQLTIYILLEAQARFLEGLRYQFLTVLLLIAQCSRLEKGTKLLSVEKARNFGLPLAKVQSLSLVKGGALC